MIRITAPFRVPQTNSESVLLEPAPSEDGALAPFETASYVANNELAFETSYCLKPEERPEGMTGFTPTLWQFSQTTITGLLPDVPIRSQSYWSQTCQTYHKPYFGDFLFESGLEQDLSGQALQLLEQQNIRIIFLRPERPWEAVQVMGIGFDGAARDWP
jgi:hypothetical protein